MIPTIGLMIGTYIGMRCFDVLCRPADSFASVGNRRVMQIIAVLVFLVNGVCMLDLFISGGSSGAQGLGR